jgi:hypothetical protein
MDDPILFCLEVLVLTEAVTHAIRSWVIFTTIRDALKTRFDFLNQLLSCFECSAVWVTTGVITYLYFINFWPLTLLLIVSRWANIIHTGIEWIDALRAGAIKKI